MTIWLVLLLVVISLVGGYISHPYMEKYVQLLFGKSVKVKSDLEQKIDVVKSKVEWQLDIAKEKGLEVEGELEEIKDDLEDIWNIIKR
jgi:hypothetical protein